MKEYFTNTKIAISFSNKWQHIKILEYFDVPNLSFNKGICSFYKDPDENALPTIYRCTGVNTWPPDYTVISYEEFEFIIDDEKVLDI